MIKRRLNPVGMVGGIVFHKLIFFFLNKPMKTNETVSYASCHFYDNQFLKVNVKLFDEALLHWRSSIVASLGSFFC